MAAYEVLLLNTAIPQIQAAQSGDTYVVPRDIAFSTVASFAAGSEATPSIVATGDANTGIWFPAADTVAISTGGISRLRLDSSGNLGLGVTPSAWGSYKAIQVNSLGISGSTGDGGISFNSFYNGSTWKFIADGQATLYNQYQGQHRFFNSNNVSGSAGGDWSPTQAMTLDASGNLVVADTTAAYTFSGRGNITIGGTTGSLLGFRVNSVNKAYVYHDGTNFDINNQANGFLSFATNATERARITSGGVFVIKSDGSTASNLANKRTTSVGTGATTISLVATSYGQLVMVTGIDGGAIFSDLIFTSITAGPTVISAKSVSGSPTSRTYTMSGDDLQLAMSSGSYDVRCTQFTNL